MSRTLVNAQINLIREAIKSYVTDPEDYENPFFWIHIGLGANTGKTDRVAPSFVLEADSMFDPSEVIYCACNQKSIDSFQANNDLKGVRTYMYDKCLDAFQRLQYNAVVVLDDYNSLRERVELERQILDLCRSRKANVLALG